MKNAAAVFLLLASFGAAQKARSPRPSPTPSPTIQRLSEYMRDVGLLYVEEVELVMDDRFEDRNPDNIERRFKGVKAIGDRIEMHLGTAADKDFYTFGLSSLLEDARHYLSLELSSLALIRDQGPEARALKASIDRELPAARKTYTACHAEVRIVIKAGEFRDYKELVQACAP